MRYAALAICLGAVLGAAPALAHHSIAAKYDREKTVDLEGRLTRVQLIQPHALFEVEVRSADGALATWMVESRGPTGLQRSGVDGSVLVVGDQVKMSGNPARSGGNAIWLSKLQTKDKTFDMSFRR